MDAPINQKQAVTNLQRYLRRLSYEYPEVVRVPIDGIFDDATRDALSEFQGIKGLPVTGVADKRTWDSLFSEYKRITEDERNIQGLYPFPDLPRDYTVSLGDTLTLVRIIQILLSELKVTYDIFEDIAESGTFDDKTQEAVRQFQLINGLPATGEVNKATWNRIVREYSNLKNRD